LETRRAIFFFENIDDLEHRWKMIKRKRPVTQTPNSRLPNSER